jgi:hypothetical protein
MTCDARTSATFRRRQATHGQVPVGNDSERFDLGHRAPIDTTNPDRSDIGQHDQLAHTAQHCPARGSSIGRASAAIQHGLGWGERERSSAQISPASRRRRRRRIAAPHHRPFQPTSSAPDCASRDAGTNADAEPAGFCGVLVGLGPASSRITWETPAHSTAWSGGRYGVRRLYSGPPPMESCLLRESDPSPRRPRFALSPPLLAFGRHHQQHREHQPEVTTWRGAACPLAAVSRRAGTG